MPDNRISPDGQPVTSAPVITAPDSPEMKEHQLLFGFIPLPDQVKGISVAAVMGATALLAIVPAGSIAWKACMVVIGLGSMLGITSDGTKSRR